jgi:tetratricopeptide (TPR) repeat protein
VNDHPTTVELEGFVWNRVPPARARAIVSHLVRGCETCQAALVPHLAGLLGVAEPPETLLSTREDTGYDAALDRAFVAAFRRVEELKEERKREALSLIADISSLEELPEVPPHLRGVPLFEALLERSWSLRHENPAEMVKVAEWARVLAEGLEPGEMRAQPIADVQCRAWIELGNAHRVADHLSDAERALGRATELFLVGTQDELLAARLFDIQASLLGDLRRFDLASTALDLVFAIYRRRGDEHLSGRALIKRGIYIGYQGQAEESVRTIERGLGLIDEDRDPRLMRIGLHNQARFLMDCGRLREARIALWKAKARGPAAGEQINELKIRWLEGQINAGLGELERAETALLDVRRGFEQAGLGYKAALAGLELGLVRLRRGHTDAAVQEVLAATDVFLSLGIAREAAASALLLRKTLDRKILDAALLEHVIGQLHRAEKASSEGPFKPTAGE